jgi:hypothetical protein
MFVQDSSAKEYFSSLLPKLGINKMDILTYFEWIKINLNLPKIVEINIGNVDENYLEYLEAKTILIQKVKSKKFKNTNFILQLENFYKENLNANHFKIFSENLKDLKFDYLDISIMMWILFEKDGFYKKEKYNKSVALDTIKTFTRKTKVEYSLVIVDEFQNYSQDQLEIIKLIRNRDSKSLTYIGDLNQKNTLKPLSVKHNISFFDDCEKVHLSKVYRNTKQILSYIKDLGYDISVPAEAREGDEVVEIKIENNLSTIENLKSELLNVLNNELEKIDKKYTIGILCDDLEMKVLLEDNFTNFTEDKNLNFRIMTKTESQGTEFNTAIVINGSLNNMSDFTGKFEELKKQVRKNNDYVGYTRAVEKLAVIKI